MNRPRVLLDVDGVLADFVSRAAQWANTVTTKASHKTCTKWDVLESWGLQGYQSWFDSVCSQRGFCADLPVYSGAKTFVRALRKDAEVVVVTSPLSCSPFWCHERTMWLANHFGFESKNVIFAKRKELVRGDVLIDDGPHNLEHFAGVRVLVDRPWNQGSMIVGQRRCVGYQQILDVVRGV